MPYDVQLSSALGSASRGELSAYELQILSEHYPELVHVFGLIDELQYMLEKADEQAERIAQAAAHEADMRLERAGQAAQEAAKWLDDLDDLLDQAEDRIPLEADEITPRPISDARETMQEIRDSIGLVIREWEEV